MSVSYDDLNTELASFFIGRPAATRDLGRLEELQQRLRSEGGSEAQLAQLARIIDAVRSEQDTGWEAVQYAFISDHLSGLRAAVRRHFDTARAFQLDRELVDDLASEVRRCIGLRAEIGRHSDEEAEVPQRPVLKRLAVLEKRCSQPMRGVAMLNHAIAITNQVTWARVVICEGLRALAVRPALVARLARSLASARTRLIADRTVAHAAPNRIDLVHANLQREQAQIRELLAEVERTHSEAGEGEREQALCLSALEFSKAAFDGTLPAAQDERSRYAAPDRGLELARQLLPLLRPDADEVVAALAPLQDGIAWLDGRIPR